MFSKKPEPQGRASRPVAKSMASNGTFSVIGTDVVITGNVRATTELHVDGKIEGDIECASLVQGEASCIEGAVKAESARLAGAVKGSITARELVVLRTARIEGDVHYDTITIEQGAEVDGRFSHRVPGQSEAARSPMTPDTAKGDEQEPKLTLAS
jgi:cytoskeletal protein CcmA (bactofilin family)